MVVKYICRIANEERSSASQDIGVRPVVRDVGIESDEDVQVIFGHGEPGD
jgi:hypothetical protein